MAAASGNATERTRTARARTPVTLVTGFLGSGKTTLINAALRAPGMGHTVVVVNEFGEIGLDHQLITASCDQIIVLENGCLCCTVRGDLVATLNELHHDRTTGRIPSFDNVVIESSGLAEPGAVVQAFLSEPTLAQIYRVPFVVTVVDAVNWEGTFTGHKEAVRQVMLADQIILTKLDLATDQKVEARIRIDVASLNPAADVDVVDWTPEAVALHLRRNTFDMNDAQADPRPWLKLDVYCNGPDCDHDHDHSQGKRVESFVLLRDKPFAYDTLQFLLESISQNLGPNLLRVKGLVNLAGESGPAVIQGAQHLLHTMTRLQRWPDTDERTRIVFITQDVAGDELRQIINQLDRIAARTSQAREKARSNLENGVTGLAEKESRYVCT